jgi:hypothetical protein
MRSVGIPELIIVIAMVTVNLIVPCCVVWLVVKVSRIGRDVEEIKQRLESGYPSAAGVDH